MPRAGVHWDIYGQIRFPPLPRPLLRAAAFRPCLALFSQPQTLERLQLWKLAALASQLGQRCHLGEDSGHLLGIACATSWSPRPAGLCLPKENPFAVSILGLAFLHGSRTPRMAPTPYCHPDFPTLLGQPLKVRDQTKQTRKMIPILPDWDVGVSL